MSVPPKISIVTIVWNDREGMELTLQSVIGQTFHDTEYIVIDGASTDGTSEYLAKHKDQIDCLVSEKDHGLYDAMNKGTKKATGDWIIYLNAGDTFSDANTLSDAFSGFSEADKVYFGRAEVTLEDGRSWFYPPTCVTEKNNIYWLRHNLPNHQAMFFPRCFYSGKAYRLDLRISSDSDFKERALASVGSVFLNRCICRFGLGGVSSDLTFKSQLHKARDRYSRFPAPRKYLDYPLSIVKGMFRSGSHLLLGDAAYIVLNIAKSRMDCIRANLQYWFAR
ncbi:glycosyltransferase family 2 protein [Planktotalea arctica]|uniref:glycosyltransferase family 2 protein n=1 Tax=Planktotalea arctica TaxID=1481893 RepID=UPI00321A381E